MTTTEQALQAIRAAVTNAGGSNVRIGQSDAVRDASPYYTVLGISDQSAGYAQAIDSDEVQEPRLGRWLVTGYGNGTDVVLTDLAALLFVPSSSVAIAFRAAGMAPERCLPLRDLTALYRSGMEPQFALEIVAAYVRSVTFTDGDANATQIDVDLNDGTLLVEVPEPA
jgi:hypothetical protein